MPSLRYAILAALALSGTVAAASEAWPSGDEATILEAVLREQCEEGQAAISLLGTKFVRSDGGEARDMAICVKLVRRVSDKKAEPAPRGFLERFQPVAAVTRASRCKVGFEAYESGTRRSAIIFTAGPVRWMEPGVAIVRGGSYRDGLTAASCEYRVRQVNGRWVVDEGFRRCFAA